MRLALAIVTLAGCGRVGFDAMSGVAGDAGAEAAPDDTVAIDTPTGGGWRLLQTSDGGDHATIVASQPGSLVLVVAGPAGGGVTDNVGNVYTKIPSASTVLAATSEGLDVWYAADAIPGAMTITGAGALSIVAWEITGLDLVAPFDHAAVLNDQPDMMQPLGPSIRTNRAGEFIMSAIVMESTATGIVGTEFSWDQMTGGDGFAHYLRNDLPANTDVGITWNQDVPAFSCSTTVAFFAK